MSGVAGFFAGAPVFWITCRQSFTTLSTAESELMSLLEGLTALRCVRSLVEMVQEKEISGRMYSDSTAAISIATGTTGSWRTRHLRIRAQGLHEALESGEVTLEHQPGRCLVADGLTKQLIGSPLQRFVQALKLVTEIQEVIQVNSLKVESGGDHPMAKRLSDSIGLIVAAASMMMTPVDAVEDLGAEDEGGWFGVICTLLVLFILIVGDLVTRFGLPKLRSWLCPKSELKVKLMNEHAVLPTRGTTGSAGLDLSACENYRIGDGDYLLIKTGIAVELPHGTYGRLASRSSMASMGVEVSAGVIDRDFRGEIKVLLHNQSGRDFWVRRGDRIAQLIVERMMEVEIHQVESLSETSRGRMGFGSTGMEPFETDQPQTRSVRSLRVGSMTYSGGSSATREEGEPMSGISTAPWPSSATTGDQERRGRVSAEELLERRPAQTPPIPRGDQMVHRCRAPKPSGDGTASTNLGTSVSVTQASRSSTTGLFEGPPANFGLCPIGAPLPGQWFQESGAFTERAKVLKVQMADIVPEDQPNTVNGCPGLVKWTLMRPSEWISDPGETLEELAMRSGFAKFWPLHLRELWNLLDEDRPSPEVDRWEEIYLNSNTVMMVRVHAKPRRKLYDFQNHTMSQDWNYGIIQLTIAKMLRGGYELISGHRCGNGAPFLDDRWMGATCFVKSKGVPTGTVTFTAPSTWTFTSTTVTSTTVSTTTVTLPATRTLTWSSITSTTMSTSVNPAAVLAPWQRAGTAPEYAKEVGVTMEVEHVDYKRIAFARPMARQDLVEGLRQTLAWRAGLRQGHPIQVQDLDLSPGFQESETWRPSGHSQGDSEVRLAINIGSGAGYQEVPACEK
eukprot:s362_g17.t1